MMPVLSAHLLNLHTEVHNVLVRDALEQVLARGRRDGAPRHYRPHLRNVAFVKR
jgi:hypothetical protein